MNDPTRIRESRSDASPELRDLFRSAAKPQPLTPVVEASLSSRISSIAAQPASPFLKLLPWLLGGAAVLAGAGALVGGSRNAAPNAVQNAPNATTAPAVSVAVPATAPVAAAPPAITTPSEKAAPHVPSSAPSAAEDALAREAGLLNQAHSVIVTNPRKALAIAQEHARRYPRGQLAAERELILVQALVKLGRTREAEVRGRELQKSAPSGIYRKRLDSILQEK